MTTRTAFVFAAAIATSAAVLAPTAPASPPPGHADCVAQYVSDFKALWPDNTVGDLQGHLGVPLPGYVFGIGGQAHYLQPFGQLLQGQATAPPTACPFDLTP
jgi:hypothetical protein